MFMNQLPGSGKISPETVVQRCSVKKGFLKTQQNSQQNTLAGVSFLIKMQTVY